MTNEQKTLLERVLGILDANNVPYNEKIKRAKNEGFDDDACAVRILKDMQTLAEYGVLNGFDRNCKADIQSLSDCAVKLIVFNVRKRVDSYKTPTNI